MFVESIIKSAKASMALTSAALISAVGSQQREELLLDIMSLWQYCSCKHVSVSGRQTMCCRASCKTSLQLKYQARSLASLPVHSPEPPDQLLISKHIGSLWWNLISISVVQQRSSILLRNGSSWAAPPTVRPEEAASDSASPVLINNDSFSFFYAHNMYRT